MLLFWLSPTSTSFSHPHLLPHSQADQILSVIPPWYPLYLSSSIIGTVIALIQTHIVSPFKCKTQSTFFNHMLISMKHLILLSFLKPLSSLPTLFHSTNRYRVPPFSISRSHPTPLRMIKYLTSYDFPPKISWNINSEDSAIICFRSCQAHFSLPPTDRG